MALQQELVEATVWDSCWWRSEATSLSGSTSTTEGPGSARKSSRGSLGTDGSTSPRASDGVGSEGLSSFSFPVRATFIHWPVQRDPSLDDFFEERLVQSAPSSGYGVAAGLPLTAVGPPSPLAALHRTPSPSPSPRAAAESRCVVLLLSDMISPQAASDDGDMPSLGSLRHGRKCKPCAFVWTPEGCRLGAQCTFCHLCDAGEKKRRQRAKKEKVQATKLRRQLRQASEQLPGEVGALTGVPIVAVPHLAELPGGQQRLRQ